MDAWYCINCFRKDDSMEKRTDLALEIRESFPEGDVEINGVTLSEKYPTDYIKLTHVKILNKHGERRMKKPCGTYITIEISETPVSESSDEIENVIEDCLMEMLGDVKDKSILVIGLGNRDATPDSLGPMVVRQISVTRHAIKEYGKEFGERYGFEMVSALAPGVMAQTGMETSEILAGVIKESSPDQLILIDALASRSVKRLGTTIQISNTGISPGAGIGNHRKGLNQKTLGVPVISIGVPTVVDAATIVSDCMEESLQEKAYSEEEIAAFMAEFQESMVRDLFVTPKNIDELIKDMSEKIAGAINHCLCNL